MLDAYTDQEFPWERSYNKEKFFKFDTTVLPIKNAEFERLVQDVYRESTCETLISAKVPAKVTTASERILTILRSILWNLYRVQKVGKDYYTSISFSSNAYSVKSAENPYGISRQIVSIIHLLHKSNHIELVKGFLDRVNGKGKTTRIRPTLGLLKRLITLPAEMKSAPILLPSMQVREGSTKKKISSEKFKNDQCYIEFEQVVNRYNKFISDQNVSVDGVKNELMDWSDKKGNFRTTDLTKKNMHSIAYVESDGRLSYFRMHGPFWQNMPRIQRHLIRINGHNTVCLDYSAQIINILGSKSGVQVPENAYDIDLGNIGLSDVLRKALIKNAIVVFVNSEEKKKGYKALRSKFRKSPNNPSFPVRLTDKFLDEVYNRIITKYPFLAQYFFMGQGNFWFKEDATVAKNLLVRFLDAGKVVLPIHDGFVVVEGDEEFLMRAMEDVWIERFGTTIQIKRE